MTCVLVVDAQPEAPVMPFHEEGVRSWWVAGGRAAIRRHEVTFRAYDSRAFRAGHRSEIRRDPKTVPRTDAVTANGPLSLTDRTQPWLAIRGAL